MKIKNGEIKMLSTCLANLKNSGLSGASGYKIVKLQSELEAQGEVVVKANDAIIKEYAEGDDQFVKASHPKFTEVTGKIDEMLNESIDLSTSNFLTEDELMGCTEGLSFDLIRVANKFLIKVENDSVE